MPLHFGLTIPVLRDPSARDAYANTYALCRLAEEVGFELGTVGHHSFTPDSPDPPAPFALLSAIAARTESLRLGTGIFLLPLHHPVSVAEQVGVLDQISGGRAVLGVGIGYRRYEYEGFGAAYGVRGARLEEGLAWLRRAWETGRIGHEGRAFSAPDLPLEPPPVQRPHPPIWVGAVARRALDRAARLGDGWISDLMQALPAERRMADLYRARCAEERRTPVVCLMRNAWVARTRDEVERDWLPRTLRFQLDYWRAGARGRDDEGLFRRMQAGESIGLQEFAHERTIAGTPADCIAQIESWREATRCDWLLLAFTGPREPAALSAAIELFGREVIPAFR